MRHPRARWALLAARDVVVLAAILLVVDLDELVASLFGGLALLLGSDAALARLGLNVGRFVVEGRVFAEGLGNGLAALWATAALPIVACTATLFLFSLWGLRRLTDSSATFTEAV